MNIAYALLLTPTIVRALGTEPYGVWSFLNGLVGYSQLLYMGLGSALMRSVAQHKARGEMSALNRTGSVVLTIFFVLGGVCCILMLVLGGLLPRVFAEPLSPDLARAAGLTCVLIGIQLWLVFIGSAVAGIVFGQDRFDAVNTVNFASLLIRFVATPWAVHRPEPLVGLASLMVATGVFEAVALAILAFRLTPGLRLRLQYPTRSELRELYGFGLQSFFVVLAVRLISYSDTTVIGFTLGAASVALYALPLQLVDYARLSVGGFTNVFLPRVTMLWTAGDFPALRQAYLRGVRIGCFLAGWLMGSLITLGGPFLTLWVGSGFGAPVQWVLIFLGVAAFAHVVASQVPFPFYQAMGRLTVPAVVLCIEGMLNLGLSIFLAPRFGIAGVAVATAIPACLVSCIVLPVYMCRRLELRPRQLLREGLWPGTLLIIAVIITQWALGLAMPVHSYWVLFVRGAATLPVVLVTGLMTFPLHEKNAVVNTVRYWAAPSRYRDAGPLW